MAKTWATATSTNDATGRVIIFRYISELDPDFKREHQPIRIIIVWKYEDTNGMPAALERQRMDEMEDALSSKVEANDYSTLALVSTGEGLREWIYYTKSEEGFLARLNQALSGRPAYPIDIHVAEDPEWTNYRDFIDSVEK